MNRKSLWLIAPAALLPYLALLALATVFFATEHPLFRFVMESLFHGNGLSLIAVLLLYCLLATALTMVFFAVSLRKGWDARSLAKCAMVMKPIQVPAYILIFVLGILLAITLFTIPFAIGLFLLDCLTLFLSGVLTAAAAINAVRQGILKSDDATTIILLQLVFCVDVVATLVFYTKLKKRLGSHEQNDLGASGGC